MTATPPVICFVGYSGVGKTTLIEKLIPVLAGRGLRVGAVKHDAHSFQMDREGKDTYRFRHAGAYAIAIASANQRAVITTTDGPTPLAALVASLPAGLDVVIAEGFKGEGAAKIEVARLGMTRLANTVDGIVAIATDDPTILGSHQGAAAATRVLALDDIDAIADFVVGHFADLLPHS